MSLQSEPIELSFEFTEDFLVEAMSRQRRAKSTVTRLVLLKILPSLLMIPIALVLIIELGEVLAGSFLITLTLFMYVAHHVDYWMAKRRHRRSHFYNELVHFSFNRESVRIKSRTVDATYQWDLFSNGVIFNDGILLFQGAALCNWLPYRCLENAGHREALAGLVKEQLGSKVSQR